MLYFHLLCEDNVLIVTEYCTTMYRPPFVFYRVVQMLMILVVATRGEEPYTIARKQIRLFNSFILKTLNDALADVICAYFVFNIAYPKAYVLTTCFSLTFCPGAKGQSKSSNICIHIVIITFSLY